MALPLGVTIEALFILLLVLANGLFAMSEAALISARSARLQEMAENGSARARAALDLLEDPNLFLSTVQIGITLVGVLAGAFGGATIAVPLAGVIEEIPVLAPYARVVSVGVVVVIIAYLSLILGELVPKRLALGNPERIASTVARPMRLLSRLAAPVVGFLSFSTNTALRVLRVRPGEQPPVTEAEIGILIDQGTRAGVFEEAERDIVERVFQLGDLRVTALMTPRPEVVWLDLESPPEARRRLRESTYSRFPVCRGRLDEVVGVVRAKDLLVRHLDGEGLDLTKDLQKPLFVPESMYAFRALEAFRRAGQHIALVVDEHGELEGVITLNDVLEALVGVLPSLDEPAGDSEAVRREDGSWLLDGAMPVNRFKEILDVRELPGERTAGYKTLAGFIMTRLGRLPAVADRFEWEGITFEVADMDGYRVDKVLVTPAAETEDEA